MSFVLEALRKSEQERQHSATAGSGLLAPAIVEERLVSGIRPIAAAAVVAALLAAVVWVSLRSPDARLPSAAPAAAAVPGEVRNGAAAPASAAVTEAHAHPVAAALLPPSPITAGDSASPPSAAIPATAAPVPAPTRPKPVEGPKAQGTVAKLTPPTALMKSKSPSAPLAAAAPGGEEPDHETPAGQPKGTPPMTIAGYIHDDLEGSIAMINDKLVREGEEVAPGLRLEKVLADGAIFSYKGQRFRR